MKHPTSEAARAVAAMFEEAAEIDKAEVNMHYAGAYLEDGFLGFGCKTVACHGGWYETMYQMKRADAETPSGLKHRSGKLFQPGSITAIRFNHGASRMAEDLGFERWDELCDWAHAHPALWGNEHGADMFSHGAALGQRRDDFSMDVLASHWNGVADRLAEREAS